MPMIPRTNRETGQLSLTAQVAADAVVRSGTLEAWRGPVGPAATVIEVPQGEYAVSFTARFHDPVTLPAAVTQNTTTPVAATLPRSMVTVIFEDLSPPNATVTWTGYTVGAAQAQGGRLVLTLPAGEYTFTVGAPGYDAVTLPPHTLERGTYVLVSATPAPGAPVEPVPVTLVRHVGFLSLIGAPQATVVITGPVNLTVHQVGQMPKVLTVPGEEAPAPPAEEAQATVVGPLPVGTYTLQITSPGYVSEQASVTVTRDATTAHSFTLQRVLIGAQLMISAAYKTTNGGPISWEVIGTSAGLEVHRETGIFAAENTPHLLGDIPPGEYELRCTSASTLHVQTSAFISLARLQRDSLHCLIQTRPPPPPPPARGTLLGTKCGGNVTRWQPTVWDFDTGGYILDVMRPISDEPVAGELRQPTTVYLPYAKIGIYADGEGGSYEQVIQEQSPDCGYMPPTHPARGTLLSQACGLPIPGTLYIQSLQYDPKYNLVGVYADGAGGTYNEVIERNSAQCGYVPPPPARGTVLQSGIRWYAIYYYFLGIQVGARRYRVDLVADGQGGSYESHVVWVTEGWVW